jgi:NADH:ubiquinone reductase (H+-translocating)
MLIIPETTQKRIVIIGAGFGGLVAVRHLRNSGYQVVLIDKYNYHLFQPLLYQIATGGLDVGSISFPIRKIFGKSRNVFFRLTEVEKIDTEKNTVHTGIGDLHYDYLVIATGSETSFFGNKNLETHSLPMKSMPEALNIRSLALQHLEEALETKDENEKKALLNFVITGGGPTGVELSGALAEMKKYVLPRDYPELDPSLMEIHLFEAGSRLLGTMSEFSSGKALHDLQKMGVIIKLNTRVNDYNGTTVRYNETETMETCNFIWAAGVRGALPEGFEASLIQRGNRILVDEYCCVKGFENIFVIGDAASMITSEMPNGFPMLAPVAMQQGGLIAENFKRKLKGKASKPFKYFDKGVMATIGRNKAVAETFFHIKLSGFLAWLAWLFVHLLFLIGIRNKIFVLLDWTWNYFTYDRASRLIVRPYKKEKGKS